MDGTFNVKIKLPKETTQKNDFIDFLIKNFDITKIYNTIENLHKDIHSISKKFKQDKKNNGSIDTSETIGKKLKINNHNKNNIYNGGPTD
ncbi:hypothetical protein KC460_02420 [Candidatus Dependentiae bacterium]|nr:hypothetical protein [Candidatus Dependentiae bacterium]